MYQPYQVAIDNICGYKVCNRSMRKREYPAHPVMMLCKWKIQECAAQTSTPGEILRY